MHYYPSCVVHLKIRFDEALHIVNTPDPVSAQSIAQKNQSLIPGTQQPRLQPLIINHGEGNATFVMDRVPIDAKFSLPGYRQAATFDLTFLFKDLPIDPRTVRAAAVECHVGTVSAEDYATGVVRVEQSGIRKSILRTRDAAGHPRADTIVLVGIIDEWTTTYSDKTPTVKISGRDMRGILLDSPISAETLKSLDSSQTIDAVVRKILLLHPQGERFSVAINPSEWPNGIVGAPAAPELLPRHRRGARRNARRNNTRPPSDTNSLNFWDVIVRYCYLVGAIPHFVGTELRIRPSRSIFEQQRAGFDPTIATPFLPNQPRTVNDQQFSVRRIVYGRDVRELVFNRKFGGQQRPKTVRCVSVDLSRDSRGVGTIVSGQWPPEDTSTQSTRSRRNSVSPSNSQSQEEILNIPVPGIASAERLTEIARGLFEEIGRNELGGHCSTKNYSSQGGSNDDPDMLRLRPGDGVEFYFDNNLNVNTVQQAYSTPFEQAVQNVMRVTGGNEDLARVIVATARGQILELPKFFRVANVDITWKNDKGFELEFEFQNYFVQRYETPASKQNQIAAPVVTNTGKRS